MPTGALGFVDAPAAASPGGSASDAAFDDGDTGQPMRVRLQEGAIGFRKAYLGSLVDRIEVDDKVIRIIGRKDVLEQAVMAGGTTSGAVRGLVRYWRPRQKGSEPCISMSCRSQTLENVALFRME